ncbi:hypothetical protein HAHE_20750 [Haloferula helveola]|uniref:Uncharacterized protein n=1 Tax=Haloferula helveola TaxID=490095 RepID=A0ABM7RA05_9BACT|nr:hypothetical protein HAHE_20750 [Haloferula helveola]
MKFITPILASVLVLHAQAFPERSPVDEATAKAMGEFLVKQGALEKDDDFPNLGKVFKGAEIYMIWVMSEEADGSATGLSLGILKQAGKVAIFSDAREAAMSLVKGYKEKVGSADELEKVMRAITEVTEVKDVGGGTYHVYNGEDFIGKPSGYVVKLEDDRIQSCRYKLEIEEE